MKKLKIALVYDRVNKIGGAERVLLAMHEIWPDAPLYTAVYDKKGAKWANVFRVTTSFLQKFPFAKIHHELYAWLTPMAFESFSFDGFDVVISVTSAEAKSIITKPTTVHICYCLTPTRYLWSGALEYQANPNVGLPRGLVAVVFKRLFVTLRRWDLIASQRPDVYIAISEIVKNRIAAYYKRSVEQVIYPPVDTGMFAHHSKGGQRTVSGGFFLVVSRLVAYKRVDLVIDAFNELGWPLVVVGKGREKKQLAARAKQNVTFVDSLTDRELAYYYDHARAFVFAGSEDFGIAAAEAQAAGIPVIAFSGSGMSEIVLSGKTGELFDVQSKDALIAALKKFTTKWYDSSSCTTNALRFAKSRFKKEMKEMVVAVYNRHI